MRSVRRGDKVQRTLLNLGAHFGDGAGRRLPQPNLKDLASRSSNMLLRDLGFHHEEFDLLMGDWRLGYVPLAYRMSGSQHLCNTSRLGYGTGPT